MFKGAVTALRAVVAVALIAFLVLSPPRLLEALGHDYYKEWLSGTREDWNGVITLWHVVGFKPAQGSITAYIESVAAKYEKEHKGIYIEVLGLAPEAAAERLSRGERPHLWSFPAGGLDLNELKTLAVSAPAFAGDLKTLAAEDGTRALPFLYSGYFLLGNTVLIQELGLAWPESNDPDVLRETLQAAMDARSTGRYGAVCAPEHIARRLWLKGALAQDGDFKAGQVPFLIGDARAFGDLTRKMATGGFTFDAMPLGGYTDLVQYLGVDKSASGGYSDHGQAFLQLLLEPNAQAKLTSLGALPAVAHTEKLLYADGQLQSFYDAYREPVTDLTEEEDESEQEVR
ncbi:MAG TPA: hypothetical protein VN366_10760 [Feifaniaceae bacterium]|nr:hypothetical protein [Feifaniaceae bacterium]